MRQTLRAFGKALTPFVSRHPYFSVLAPVWLALAVYVLYPIVREPTVEAGHVRATEAELRAQMETEEEARRIRAAAARVEFNATKGLCQLKSACRRYGDARQQCAASGDFQRCIEGKMGEAFPDAMNCTNDGHIAGSMPEPGALECLFH